MIHTLNMTFFTLTWGTTPMDKSILQILQFATKIRIHHRFFCGDNFTSKNFRELYLVELLFNIKQGYSLQPKTLLSSITYDFMRVFWKSSTENFEKLSKKTYVAEYVIELHEYSLQPTTGLIHSVSAKKGKDVLKFRKSKKSLCETVPFF